MIEAVNSVISSAPLIRGNAEALAASNSFAADAVAVQTVARMPLAPFISPYISVNTDYDKAVLQVRDSDTGDVVTQFPSEQTLRARQRQEVAQLNQQLSGEYEPEPIPVVGGNSKTVSISQNVPSGITFVQESAPTPVKQSSGAGVAQAAIDALSLGASIGQPTSTVSVTA
jgi:hypothetical protein